MCHATDLKTRFEGASGGVLSAIASGYLKRGGKIVAAVSAGSLVKQKKITNSKEILDSQGSQYRPVRFAEDISLESLREVDVITLRPCQASALRKTEENLPLVMSFFCAGVPTQDSFLRLLKSIGFSDENKIKTVRFRGHGWPGMFRISSVEGTEVEMSYEDSWGQLGKDILKRCTICPDSVGESADLVGADPWELVNSRASFIEAPGKSAVFIRTTRGLEAFNSAVDNGEITVLGKLNIEEFLRSQEYQVRRRASSYLRNFAHFIVFGVAVDISTFRKNFRTSNTKFFILDFLKSLSKFLKEKKAKRAHLPS